MLYLLDANVLLMAHKNYYPIDQVPEFWEWLIYQAEIGNAKIPLELLDEVVEGRTADDLLCAWVNEGNNKDKLLLDEEVDRGILQRVINDGYAPDLTDIELLVMGKDPFLVTYGLMAPDRFIVTTEISKQTQKRHHRRLPDVCSHFGLPCGTPFAFNRLLGFRTSWRRSLP